MFRTIFSKMVVIFIAILLISFTITSAILYYFLSDFVIADKVKSLRKTGDVIQNSLKNYWDNRSTPYASIYQRSFEDNMSFFSQYTNSVIWVVNEQGHIIMTEPDMNPIVINRLTDSAGNLKLPDERQYKKVMGGKAEYIKESGDFYGLFKDTKGPYLTIEVPFSLSIRGQKLVGAIYLHTRIPEVQKARTTLFRLFIVSVAISILIAIILIYILSLRISRPLKQIKNAAKVIAGGEFQKRLNIKSKDEIGQLAASFDHMAYALQNLEEMRRDFIANVSHELRTPMTSIRGFVEGILDGTIPYEKQNDYLIIVRDETNRLNRLVNNLLDLAKLESGEMALSVRSFDINELIRRCIIRLEKQIIQKNLQIEAVFESEVMFVKADADAIERVVINLLHNAVKFTGENGKITFSTSLKKDNVQVSIEDSGVGIHQDEIDLIWERFYKSDKSRGKDRSGTGLGLAIIKNIINEHKQEIGVESEVGKGTKFTFTLEKSNNED